jgi:hypothetical protein
MEAAPPPPFPEATSRNIVKVNTSFGIQNRLCNFYAYIDYSLIYQLRLNYRNIGIRWKSMRNIKRTAHERLERDSRGRTGSDIMFHSCSLRTRGIFNHDTISRMN